MTAAKIYDVAVVGAGVFGAWTALHLARRGKRVLLVDAYGPGHSRSSSGDESRIIRMGYGADEIYTRWSRRSLVQWKELFAASGNAALFRKTGVLWLAEAENPQLRATKDVLKRNGVEFEELDRTGIVARCPQINLDGIASGILEPESGVLMARRAVAAAVAEAVRIGVEFKLAAIAEPHGNGQIESVSSVPIEGSAGERFTAKTFVFACGAWLAKLFPELLADRIFPTRQSVFYFGIPAWRRAIFVPSVADLADQERRMLWNAGSGEPRPENRAGQTRRASRSGHTIENRDTERNGRDSAIC